MPDGFQAGDEMTVAWCGTNYSVTVPDGCIAGAELDIQLPTAAQQPAIAFLSACD